jgi:hypothetical protein
MLPQYRFEPGSGTWRHVGGQAEVLHSLGDIAYSTAGMSYPAHRRREPESRLADYLDEARRVLADPPPPAVRPQGPGDLDAGPDFEALRWFLLPAEAAEELAAQPTGQ